MPYLTCSSCGLRTYCVSEGTCPACGTHLRRSTRRSVRAPAATPRSTRCSPWPAANSTPTPRCCRRSAAAASTFAGPWAATRARAPLRDTICERLLDGRIGAVVADTTRDPAVRDLPAVRDAGIRAYIGVPFTMPDARAYVLCCLAYEARPDLGEGDVRFLKGMVESLRPLLERA